MSDPAHITIRQRIQWSDTDAAGVYHWLAAFRLVEAAEAALHDRLGIRQVTFGQMPRAHADADFRSPLRFYDLAETELRVTAVGRTSVTYAFTIHRDDVVAVEGSLVAVLVDAEFTGVALPDDVRAKLLTGGRQHTDS